MHVFISPHLDDAVLSCGGLIHQLVQRGEMVAVLTVITADPPSPLPDTPLVQDLHRRWQAGENPYETRRQEDRLALQTLGVHHIEYLGLPDCPYRSDSTGSPLYPQNHHLFGTIHPDDPAQAFQIPLPAGTQSVYAPLGAGGHVDHQIVNQVCRRLDLPVYYYEEYPYSANSGEALRITDGSPHQQVGTAAVQSALDRFNQPMQPRLIYLSGADLAAKIAATACYRSQISSFWDNEADMATRIRAYAQEVASPAAERLWVGTWNI